VAKQSGEIETRQQITGAFREEPIVGRGERYSFHGNSISSETEPITRTLDFSRLCVNEKVFPRANMHVLPIEDPRFITVMRVQFPEGPYISRFYVIETQNQRNNGYSRKILHIIRQGSIIICLPRGFRTDLLYTHVYL